jgi:hypothetical protein
MTLLLWGRGVLAAALPLLAVVLLRAAAASRD